MINQNDTATPVKAALTGVAVNVALAERLLACAGSGGDALELYAGAGSFTLALARRFEQLVALEADPNAVRDLLASNAIGPVRMVITRQFQRLPPADAKTKAASLAPRTDRERQSGDL